MKVYVVSLRRDVKRRQYIEEHLKSLELEYEIVDATDYQEMTPEDFTRLVSKEAVEANPFFTKGVQACALSHAKVCELIAASKDKAALLIEDDIILASNIKSLLDSVEQEIENNEIISLAYYTHVAHDKMIFSLQKASNITNNGTLFYPTNIDAIASAMGYILTPSVAARLSTTAVPVRVPADAWGEFYRNGIFNSFRCLYPMPIEPALFPSTIDYAASVQSGPKKMITLVFNQVAALVRKYKVPFLFAYLEARASKLINKKSVIQFAETAPFNEVRATQVEVRD